jgi:site-specific recombinase XerD
VVLDGAACVHLHGKGRKDRSVPLWKSTAAAIRAWLHANPDLRGSAALLPNRSGHAMTRCNVAQRLALAVNRASVEQPGLKAKRISPHSLRHTTAMHLLQSGVPFNVIALWLGHESTKKRIATSRPTWRSRRRRSPESRHRTSSSSASAPATT